MLRRAVQTLLIAIVFLGGLAFGQFERDEVLNITYPTTGVLIDADSVVVTFDIATYFTIGDSGCADCDGYLKAYLDGDYAAGVFGNAPFTITGLTDGSYELTLEAVDTAGVSFAPAIFDTVSFEVAYEENFCPPSDLVVQDDVRFGALAVRWRTPSPGGFYFNDFESGEPDFVASGEWQLGGPSFADGPATAWSGDFLWGTNLTEDYGNTSNSTLDSPPISLAGYSAPELRFWHWYDTEFSWDGGNVKISLDDGISWTVITPLVGYDDDAASTSNAGIPGEPCFSGHDQGIWEEVVFDLSAYIGETVMLRWHFGSDGSVTYPGWYIDDISVGDPQNRLADRTIIQSCGDLLRYEVFRDSAWIADSDTNYYLDTNVTVDTEYCYFVQAVYDSAGAEFVTDTTNNACGIPVMFTPLPPVSLTALAGDSEVFLDWAEPGTIILEGDFCSNALDGGVLTPGFDQVFTGTTAGFNNDYSNGTDAVGPDVVYEFTVTETVYATASLCDGADWDTYLMLFNSSCDSLVGFDDDSCGAAPSQSTLAGTLTPGNYKLVLDGWSATAFGTYSMTVTASTPTGAPGFPVPSRSDKIMVTEQSKNASLGRDISGSSVVSLSGFMPGTVSVTDFRLTVVTTDYSECDSFSLTFPAGVTPLDAGPDALGGAYSNETYNGVDGQTVSWGSDRDNGSGGISGSIDFWVTLMVDANQTDSITCDYFFSDDGDATILDASGSFVVEEHFPVEGEFLGYNVFVNGSTTPDNPYLFLDSEYLVQGLTNGVQQDFTVNANYFPDYESGAVSVSATPTWLFGDISGTVYDPSGNPLDSAVVKVGPLTDTTGTDGAYYFEGLIPYEYSVSVSRNNFSRDAADVTVLAQEAAVVQDFTLIPVVDQPSSLTAVGEDGKIHLKWLSPGAKSDELIENFDLELPEDWTVVDGGTSTDSWFWTTDDAGNTLDGTPFIMVDSDAAGTTAELDEQLISPALNTSSAVELYLLFDQYLNYLSGENCDVDVWNGVDWITVASFAEDHGAWNLPERQIIDISEHANHELQVRFHYYNSVYDWYWALDNIIVTAEQVDGVRSFSYELTPFGWEIQQMEKAEILEAYPAGIDWSLTVDQESVTNEVVYRETLRDVENAVIREYTSAADSRTYSSREDSLAGYFVYRVGEASDTLLTATAIADTVFTDSSVTNSIEYCYYVKASWNTAAYGVIESKPTSIVCGVPFLPGDVDFIDGVSVSDLLFVVDFALGAILPTPEQVRGADINNDGLINIQDIIMIVDIIMPPASSRSIAGTDDPAVLELIMDGQSNLNAMLDYSGAIRGSQFLIKYDANAVELGQPRFNGAGSGVLVNYSETVPGEMLVMIANIEGGYLKLNGETLISIPLTAKGKQTESTIDLNKSVLIGSDGSIAVTEKSVSLNLQGVPTIYALHQNYPNPFNPDTEIMFDLPKENTVQLTIYNLMGQKVRTLVNGDLSAGFHSVRWNGMNDSGSPVATGMYFYQINSGKFHATKKMVLLK